MIKRIIDRIRVKWWHWARRVSDRRLLRRMAPFTMMTDAKLKTLLWAVREVNDAGVSGDVIECGAYKGGSAGVLGRAMSQERHLWIYDSFEGMPETTNEDGDDARAYVGDCKATEADVRSAMDLAGIEPGRYTIRKGMFADSFQEESAKVVAILHCDCDWYESVSMALETFYDRIPEGGCVILDDFGYWEGCRRAFYDFCVRTGEKPLLERVWRDQAYWVKGKQHNR